MTRCNANDVCINEPTENDPLTRQLLSASSASEQEYKKRKTVAEVIIPITCLISFLYQDVILNSQESIY